MSAAKTGRKWADVDEEDEDEVQEAGQGKGSRFETPVDEHGIKTVVEYTERNGKTYKVSTKVRETKVSTWTNKYIAERKNMVKFGKAAENTAEAEKQLVVHCVEEVTVEFAKKLNQQVVVKDDAEEKFYEESITLAEGLNKEKKVWTDANKEKREADDAPVGVAGPGETAGNSVSAAMKGEAAPAKAGAPGAYVPPSLRAADGKGDGKGKGKDMSQEASLRVTNLSEDCREGDLQDLFGQFGALQRVYLAKDMETFQSRGFAFITYYTKKDAQRAIDKLHGHGYDNLILSVQFAKPKQ